MREAGFIELKDTLGNLFKLMKITFLDVDTQFFFDFEAAKMFPYDGEAEEEIFPS